MTSSTLIQERPMVFYPSLAATLGLEEAVMLHQLTDLMHYRQCDSASGYHWLEISPFELAELLPFWTLLDLQRIANNLVAKGVLLCDNPALATSECFRFALNEKQPTTQAEAEISPPQHSHNPAPHRAPAATHSQGSTDSSGARRLSSQWAPSPDILELLKLNHGVSREFALDQLEDFILYWTERGEANHAWDNKFRQHVLGRWRHHQQHISEQRISAPDKSFDRHWQPGEDALEILIRDGVNLDFIEDTVPEFVLYWSERPGAVDAPNSKFIAHIRRQWRRFTSTVDCDGEERQLPANWKPDPAVFDILDMANIDAAFAHSLLPEFLMYWQDSQQMRKSWNTKFLQHVKYHWARRHQLVNNGTSNAGQQRHRAGSTRARSIAEDLSDRSWAN